MTVSGAGARRPPLIVIASVEAIQGPHALPLGCFATLATTASGRASLNYDLGKLAPVLNGAKLSVVAKNLFDKYYVAQCGNVPGCTPGSRRTVLATLSYRW